MIVALLLVSFAVWLAWVLFRDDAPADDEDRIDAEASRRDHDRRAR